MSKLLKVIVNTLLLLAILSAGALVIPPFAGITTLAVSYTHLDVYKRQHMSWKPSSSSSKTEGTRSCLLHRERMFTLSIRVP